MEDAKLKSRHVIDLRESAGTGPKEAPAKPQGAHTAHKPAPRPSLRRKAPVAPPPSVAAASTVAAAPDLPEPNPVASARAAQPAYLDAPPGRRFWPAFWRFLLLLVVLGLLLTGGVYLYLKYST